MAILGETVIKASFLANEHSNIYRHILIEISTNNCRDNNEMAISHTAANTGRVFMPLLSIPQLRSRNARDFGCGNLAAFRETVSIAAASGINALCIAPVNETEPELASLFSRSSNNALSTRIVALDEIPEIAGTPELADSLDKALAAHSNDTSGRKMNIPLVERENNRFLMEAYEIFLERTEKTGRKADAAAFALEQGWWLKPYSAFNTLKKLLHPASPETWDPAFFDLSCGKTKTFLNNGKAKYLRGFYEFSQFEADRQMRAALQHAHDLGIEEIELLMGVGVSRMSAEAFMMGDLYDRFRQIGCLPEPENGYPLQLWGFPAERAENSAALEFKANSIRHMQELGFDRISLDHAAGLLGGYFTFPVYDEALLNKGNFRLLNADNPSDAATAINDCRWDCDGKDPNDHANVILSSILERVPDMKLSAETVGDYARRAAAESSISRAIERGHDITLMEALPWWNAGKNPTLHDYSQNDRLSLTHDMPALTALMTGRVGDHVYPWINGGSVAGFLNRLGILAPQVDRPLKISELSPEFMFEVMRRICCGSSAGTVSLPLATLLNLKEDLIDGGKWQCINIQPGTEGVVDEAVNKVGNFLQRMPEIENLEGLENLIGVLASRKPEFFDPPFDLMPVNPDDRFRCQVRKAGSSVAYQAADGKWTVWAPKHGEKPIWELAFAYSGCNVLGEHEDKAWAAYPMGLLEFHESRDYIFLDLSGNVKPQTFSGWELVGGSLPIGLNPYCSRHHFVILEQ